MASGCSAFHQGKKKQRGRRETKERNRLIELISAKKLRGQCGEWSDSWTVEEKTTFFYPPPPKAFENSRRRTFVILFHQAGERHISFPPQKRQLEQRVSLSGIVLREVSRSSGVRSQKNRVTSDPAGEHLFQFLNWRPARKNDRGGRVGATGISSLPCPSGEGISSYWR